MRILRISSALALGTFVWMGIGAYFGWPAIVWFIPFGLLAIVGIVSLVGMVVLSLLRRKSRFRFDGEDYLEITPSADVVGEEFTINFWFPLPKPKPWYRRMLAKIW